MATAKSSSVSPTKHLLTHKPAESTTSLLNFKNNEHFEQMMKDQEKVLEQYA
jgi:hypothetical protein